MKTLHKTRLFYLSKTKINIGNTCSSTIFESHQYEQQVSAETFNKMENDSVVGAKLTHRKHILLVGNAEIRDENMHRLLDVFSSEEENTLRGQRKIYAIAPPFRKEPFSQNMILCEDVGTPK